MCLAIPNFGQPYFAELARAAVAAADDAGMRLIVQQTDNLLQREREAADSWNLGSADGLISPPVIDDNEIETRRGRAPLVRLGERSKLSSVDRVGIDSVAISHAATKHLLDQGRTRLLMIGDKTFGDPFVVSEREAGFHRALEEAGLHEAGPVGGVRDWTRGDGARVVDEILDAGAEFDGIFCATSPGASVGGARALRAATWLWLGE